MRAGITINAVTVAAFCFYVEDQFTRINGRFDYATEMRSEIRDDVRNLQNSLASVVNKLDSKK